MKVKVTACKCERCEWVCLPRGYPKVRTSKKCPHCGSYYWDTPRIKPKVEPPKVQAKEEIVSIEPPKEDDIDALKRDCLACTEKYKTGDGKWQCTSFSYKNRYKYDRCRLCWELIEIWGEQAAGYKERIESNK